MPSIHSIKRLVSKALLLSTIPLALYAACYIVEPILAFFWRIFSPPESKMLNYVDNFQLKSLTKRVGDIALAVYDTYLGFIVTMFILHFALEALLLAIHLARKPLSSSLQDDSDPSHMQHYSVTRQAKLQLLLRGQKPLRLILKRAFKFVSGILIMYSLCFCFYKAFGVYIYFTHICSNDIHKMSYNSGVSSNWKDSVNFTHQHIKKMPEPGRVMTCNPAKTPEGLLQNQAHLEATKLYSSHARILQQQPSPPIIPVGVSPLGFIDVPGVLQSYAVSSDATTVFAISHDNNKACDTFYILDFSDIASASIITSRVDNDRLAGTQIILKEDGRTLLIIYNNSTCLEIKDVSLLYSPKSLNHTCFLNSTLEASFCNTFLPDDQILLLCGAMSLVDVSNSTSPTLIKQLPLEGNLQGIISSAVYPEDNGTTMFVSVKYADEISENYLLKTFYIDPTFLNMVEISSYPLPATFRPVAMLLPPDGQTLFVSLWNYHGEASLGTINVSNRSSPVGLVTVETHSNSQPLLMAISLDGRVLYWPSGGDVIAVNVTDPNTISIINSLGTFPEPISVILSRDNKLIFLFTDTQLKVGNLLYDLHINKIFTPQNPLVPRIPLGNPSALSYNSSYYPVPIFLFDNGKTVYIPVISGQNTFELQVINTSEPTSLDIVDLSQLSDPIHNAIALYNTTLYISTSSAMYIFDMSDLQNSSQIFSFAMANTTLMSFSFDGEIALVRSSCNMFLIDTSTLSSLKITTNFSSGDQYACMTQGILAGDGKTAFIIEQHYFEGIFESRNRILIFNATNPTQPFVIYMADTEYLSLALLPDEETLLTVATINLETFLIILSISDLGSYSTLGMVQILSPQNLDPTRIPVSVSISPDSQTVWIYSYGTGGLVKIDISDQTQPTILGFIPLPPSLVGFVISQNCLTAYCVDTSNTLYVLDISSSRILYMSQNTFQLGNTYTNYFVPLILDTSTNTYRLIEEPYKLVSISLYQVQVMSINASQIDEIFYPLPNWMSYDLSSGNVYIEPKGQASLGSYNFHAFISTQISSDIFYNPSLNLTYENTDAVDLMSALVSLGYIDTDGFLTSTFDPNQPLLLSSRYLPDELIIRLLLTQNYIQLAMMQQFSVVSSLNTLLPEYLLINTLSKTTLNVLITLNSQAQFVEYAYPVLTTIAIKQSTITIDGLLADVNTALQKLIVNLNDTAPCDGSITVSDNLNPPLTQEVANISRYFIINQTPIQNMSVQDQIDKYSVKSGGEFLIPLNPLTFVDANGLPLTYTLTMQPNKTVPPNWLALRGLDLIGTLPDELFPSDIQLCITASNGYKSVDITFTLSVGLSLIYILTFLIKYVGLPYAAFRLRYQIYNILCKRRYRYPKDFSLKVNEEISLQGFPTIRFIAEEQKESELIIKELEVATLKKMQANFQENKNMSKPIVVYFLDPDTQILNQDKLSLAIDDAANSLLNARKDSLKLYFSKINPNSEMTKRLIANKLIMRQLNLKLEKTTKKAFDALKLQFTEFVDYSSPSYMNNTELEDKIATYCSKLPSHASNRPRASQRRDDLNTSLISLVPLSHENDKRQLNLRTELIDSGQRRISDIPQVHSFGINEALLKQALSVYIFRRHSFDVNLVNVGVVIKKRRSKASSLRKVMEFLQLECLMRYLKLDLGVLPVMEGRTHFCGIRHSIDNSVLHVSGTPEEKLQGETLVIQVVKKNGKILMELWCKMLPPAELNDQSFTNEML